MSVNDETMMLLIGQRVRFMCSSHKVEHIGICHQYQNDDEVAIHYPSQIDGGNVVCWMTVDERQEAIDNFIKDGHSND